MLRISLNLNLNRGCFRHITLVLSLMHVSFTLIRRTQCDYFIDKIVIIVLSRLFLIISCFIKFLKNFVYFLRVQEKKLFGIFVFNSFCTSWKFREIKAFLKILIDLNQVLSFVCIIFYKIAWRQYKNKELLNSLVIFMVKLNKKLFVFEQIILIGESYKCFITLDLHRDSQLPQVDTLIEVFQIHSFPFFLLLY